MRDQRSVNLAIAGAVIVYALFGGVALWWGIEAYKPCVTNFEGGCSMGKGMLAMGSSVAAGIAASVAFAVFCALLLRPQKQPFTKIAAIALGLVPLAYTAYTLKAVLIG